MIVIFKKLKYGIIIILINVTWQFSLLDLKILLHINTEVLCSGPKPASRSLEEAQRESLLSVNHMLCLKPQSGCPLTYK